MNNRRMENPVDFEFICVTTYIMLQKKVYMFIQKVCIKAAH